MSLSSPTQVPTHSVAVAFNCPPDLATTLTAFADAKGVPLSSFIADLVVTPLRDQLAEMSETPANV